MAEGVEALVPPLGKLSCFVAWVKVRQSTVEILLGGRRVFTQIGYSTSSTRAILMRTKEYFVDSW